VQTRSWHQRRQPLHELRVSFLQIPLTCVTAAAASSSWGEFFNPTCPDVRMRLSRLVTALLIAAIPLAATAAGKTACHDGGRYRVVAKATESVGTDFLIKYTPRGRSIPACRYAVRAGDFEIRNERAEYFLGLQGALLILDSGTAPEPRGLIVWDLEKRQKVFTGTYSPPYSIDAAGMRFWAQSSEATDANCPQAAGWRANGLGAALETETTLNFADLSLTPSENTRCSARQ
jgi:hypothetical protein